jgi:hypothetical protein
LPFLDCHPRRRPAVVCSPPHQSPGAPSFAISSRRVGCKPSTRQLLPPPLNPRKNPRVPHPSQSHREGWDVNRQPASFSLPTQPTQKSPGAPSFAVSSRRVGCKTVTSHKAFDFLVVIPQGSASICCLCIFFLRFQPKNRMSSPLDHKELQCKDIRVASFPVQFVIIK